MRIGSLLRGTVFVGLFFFLLPWALIGVNEACGWPRWRNPILDVAGSALIASGAAVCLHCMWLFWVRGRGTPVPTQPHEKLVVAGLFRYFRHPMYVGYVAIATGVALVEGHAALVAYPIVLFLLSEIYLVVVEEPGLRRRYGAEYERYSKAIPRWPGARPAA